MRLPALLSPVSSRSTYWGHAWIGAGLTLLLLNAWNPAVPAVTAMGLVALGATGVMAARFRGTQYGFLVVILNFAVYGLLYALFVGATIHSSAALASARIDAPKAIDLVASAWPMTAAFAISWRALLRF
jgi:hypothetical protein